MDYKCSTHLDFYMPHWRFLLIVGIQKLDFDWAHKEVEQEEHQLCLELPILTWTDAANIEILRSSIHVL